MGVLFIKIFSKGKAVIITAEDHLSFDELERQLMEVVGLTSTELSRSSLTFLDGDGLQQTLDSQEQLEIAISLFTVLKRSFLHIYVEEIVVGHEVGYEGDVGEDDETTGASYDSTDSVDDTDDG